MPLKLICTIAVVITGSLYVCAQNFNLVSPDNKVSITISNDSLLQYSLLYNGSTVIHPSPLGFTFRDELSMGREMVVSSSVRHTVSQTWAPVVKSRHSLVTDHYNELVISLVEKTAPMRRMNMYFRAYNDGVAFRYQLFGAERIGDRQITGELTGFNVSAGSKAWVADFGKYTSSQETEFKRTEVGQITKGTVAGLPFLIQMDTSKYAAITEADLDNYPGFYIGTSDPGPAGALTTRLAPLRGEKEDGVKVRFSNDLYTPWRTILLASTPGKLIESELVANLNPPCAIKDVSWIRPGMSAWDNWWSGDVKMDMPTIRKYIDLASAQQWPYMLIDWQWYGPFNKPEADITKPAPQLDMPAILAYAKSRHVKCWLWLYSSDVNRNDNFKKAFPLYRKWGIAGIKIDFMDRDDQQMVNWYRRIIAAAAENHLMVDFHGAYKPDGIVRTYPNMITREGVMGEEYSKFSNRLTPEHNVTLPFTRMLAGQMDYTPGGFLNVKKEDFRMGVPTMVMNSRCAELAKFVIYESPFMVYCDAPEHILGQPGADFLKNMPTVWDDTKVLGGYPGEYIVIARRSGNTWYLGAMTNGEERTIRVKADFLQTGSFSLTSWSDVNGAPQKLTRSENKITSKDVIDIHIDKAGGWAGKIKKGN